MGCTKGEKLIKCSAGKKLLGMAVMILMCLTAFASLALRASAEPVEYINSPSSLSDTRVYTCTVEDAGKLYTIGGLPSDIGGSGFPQKTVLIHDIATGVNTKGTDAPLGTAYETAAMGIDGRIYVFGGFNATLGGYTMMTQIYNVSDNSWTSGAPSPLTIGSGAAVTVPNGTIYLFGAAISYNSTLVYHPSSDTWTYARDQPNAAWLRRAVYWNSTAIIVMGGRIATVTNVVDIYNPVSDAWSSAAPMPLARNWGGAGVGANGFVYYVGGISGSWPSVSPPTADVQRYDPETNEWEISTASLPTPRDAFGMVTDSYGRMFLAAGYDGSSAVSTVSMIVTTDFQWDHLTMTSPTAGSIVSGTVAVTATISNPNSGFSVLEFYVDGALIESRGAPPGGSTVFLWDTSSLADGSPHVLMVRGYTSSGLVREDSATVFVSAQSVEERVAALEQEIAVLQTKLNSLNSSVGAIQNDINALQAQLNLLKTNQTTQSAKLDQLQTQLNDMQSKLNKVKTSSDSGSMYGIVSIVLMVVVLALLAMMFMASRKKP